jgi:hypothetical protein
MLNIQLEYVYAYFHKKQFQCHPVALIRQQIYLDLKNKNCQFDVT